MIRAGRDKNGDRYVILKNNIIFYGDKSSPYQKKYYNLLINKKQKQRLPFECFNIAKNIIIRFYEGGLQYGGPKKEAEYNCKKGDVVVEMGSYQGFYTLYLSRKVGDRGEIIAIEPDQENFYYLQKNIKCNRLKNVKIINKGVWHKKDELPFFRNKQDKQSGSLILDKIEGKDRELKKVISVDSLDNILGKVKIKKIDFMLIQLNGAEPNALLGLTNFYPKNLSIAARYKFKDDLGVNEVIRILRNRKYNIKVKSRYFIYAQKNEI